MTTVALHAQQKVSSLSGAWTGNYSRHIFMSHPEELLVEINIYNDTMITGASHLLYKDGSYEHYKISGKVSASEGLVVFTEDSVISIKVRDAAVLCRGQYVLELSETRKELQLSGEWIPVKQGLIPCPNLQISIVKPMVLPSSTKKGRSSVSSNAQLQRVPDIQRVVDLKPAERDSIRIQLYDNGEIDDDSVSVYIDSVAILRGVKLTAQPVEFTIAQTSQRFKVILAADNLGRIPPNTALMVIHTKLNRYEIHLSSSKEKNAVVDFFLVQ